MDSEPFAELADELDRLSERLSEAAMDVLRDAVAAVDGADEFSGEDAAVTAKRLERRINRARAAVERAAHLLRDTRGSPSTEEWGGDA